MPAEALSASRSARFVIRLGPRFAIVFHTLRENTAVRRESSGLSLRRITEILGVSDFTVRQDLSGLENSKPETHR
ncbi:DeoR family transcriptional regulator [Rhodothermus marinus]|uniref:DeoR family transcriptional regulator n=1 Tax=Rhodothermus marinus TaxID=29549 RepID=UPI003D6DB41D